MSVESAVSEASRSPRQGASSILKVCLIVTFLLLTLWYSSDVLDDPYITYRYSRNLARGIGLIWNRGEHPVEGYSNFLWAVMHAPFIAAGISPLFASKVISLVEGCALLLLILSPINAALQTFTWRFVMATCVALCPPILFFGFSGMETLQFIGFVTAAVLLWSASREGGDRSRLLILASLCTGLAALTRPEGPIVWFLLVACEAVVPLPNWTTLERTLPQRSAANRRADLCRLALPFLALWLPYFCWRFHFYGYPFPNTFYAKHTGKNVENLRLGIQYVWMAKQYLLPPLIVTGIALGYAAFSNSNATPRVEPAVVLRLIPPAVLTGTFLLYAIAVGGDDTWAFPGTRLLLPIFPAMWMGMGVACEHACKRLTGRARLVAAVVTLLCVGAPIKNFVSYSQLANPTYRNPGSLLSFLSTKVVSLPVEHPGPSLWMRQTTVPTDLVSSNWAGRPAYFSDRPFLDLLGLNDEHIAHMPKTTGGIDVKMDPVYTLARRPALIVMNLPICAYDGSCPDFDMRAGDRELIRLLRESGDYTLETNTPFGAICVFRRKSVPTAHHLAPAR
jgi:hypothetical protein